jgi:hypothetical protein
MAESITEGTLKQWLKQKGDYVEADEEIATIETDKVRLLSFREVEGSRRAPDVVMPGGGPLRHRRRCRTARLRGLFFPTYIPDIPSFWRACRASPPLPAIYISLYLHPDSPRPSFPPLSQIDVAVNAPKAGLITELLAAEEDTVAVGQDLFKLDPEGKNEGGGASFFSLPLPPSLPFFLKEQD